MSRLLTTCPVCSEELTAVRLHCRSCDTTIEGRFDFGRLGRLSQDQLEFVEAFIGCEGKLNRLEKELDLSYPTLRSRLNEIIRQMGYELGPESTGLDEQDRTQILDDLANGKLSSEEAMQMLAGE